MLDRAIQWIAVYPLAPETAKHTIETLRHLAGSTDKIASFYSDNGPELAAAARACKWRFATSTTGQPQTNGVADTSVRAVKEGGGCGACSLRIRPPSGGLQQER